MYKRGTCRLAVLSLRLKSELIRYCFWLISRRKAVTNAAPEKWPGNNLRVFKNDPAATKSLKPWLPQWKRRAVSNRQVLTGKESISISWMFWMKDVVELARDMTTQRLFSFYLTQCKDTYMYTTNQHPGLNDSNHVNGFNILRNNLNFGLNQTQTPVF